jgi:cation:H+ antiporter
MPYRRYLAWMLLAALVTLPGTLTRLAGVHMSAPMTAVLAGVAVLGAAFLLLWACDAAQKDISQALAIAIVALIAVLPEYAVDMYFTWRAGHEPQYAQYAIANMTGANRLLIGIGWVAIAVIFWIKTRKAVFIGRERRTELFFLGLATLYAFVIPIKGSLAWYDGVVFLGLYVWYIIVAGRRPCTECDVDGPAELLMSLRTVPRRLATLGLFLFAALTILANAEPFSEGLVHTGKLLHINEFLLVQWLAPIASEAPEFVVAIMFALRGQAGLALGSLLSSKLNQWTLLVGMIPGVYAASSGQLHSPIPMGSFQMHEVLLTAAQSALAVVMLVTLRLSVGQSLLLLGLFLGQFILPSVVEAFPGLGVLGLQGEQIHQLFSLLYLVAAFTLFLDKPGRFRGLMQGLRRDLAQCDILPHTPDAVSTVKEDEEPALRV